MRWLRLLQLLGPFLIFTSVSAAEASALALNYLPNSQWLWYVNLRWFGFFQRSQYVVSNSFENAFIVDYWQWRFVALPLLAAGLFGFFFKRRLLLAVSANLSLVYAAFLLYCSWVYAPTIKAASLGFLSVRAEVTSNVTFVLLVVCTLSFLVSHICYFRAFRGRDTR